MSMERLIVANRNEDSLITALIEDGKLCEYWEDGKDDPTGRIVKGRVERIVPGMQAAFIQIGLEKNGFLPLDERPQQETIPLPPLKTGQEILVQVKKAPSGQKGAYLTRAISLAGEFALLLPGDRFIGVSARIQAAEERKQLRLLGEKLLPEGFGLVMRGAAISAAVEAILEEISALMAQWQGIVKEGNKHNAPFWLTGSKSTLDQLLQDYVGKVDRLITNDEKAAARFAKNLPTFLEKVQDLNQVYSISKQMEKGLQRKVWLKSGGYLVIDPCEAMTVIDVNTGKFTGKHQLEETMLHLNLEACQEIARQARLRNIGGIILVDFIDLEHEAHRQQVAQALFEAFSHDRIKTVLHGFTSLGLMEMTRKKTSNTLLQQKTIACPRCHGEGRIAQGGMADE